jgi:ATP-binding cassette, subfamily G (WHITE), member 2, SNQ2
LQNFGIICAFGIAFIAAYWAFTEFNTRMAGQQNVIWFKRGSKVDIIKESQVQALDEEKGTPEYSFSTREKGVSSAGDYEKRAENADAEKTHTNIDASTGAPVMTDVFTWQHLEYAVTMPDGSERRLLDDVSGFVAPGKLTALMGESGAGKV